MQMYAFKVGAFKVYGEICKARVKSFFKLRFEMIFRWACFQTALEIWSSYV